MRQGEWDGNAKATLHCISIEMIKTCIYIMRGAQLRHDFKITDSFPLIIVLMPWLWLPRYQVICFAFRIVSCSFHL